MTVNFLTVLILIIIILMQRNKPDHLLIDPDDALRDNYVTYEEEGAGRLHFQYAGIFHVVILLKYGMFLFCRGGRHACL